MRRVIIIVACVGLLFLALLALTGTDDGNKPDGRTYRPPAWARLLGAMASPFAPRLDIGTRTVSLQPNQPARFSIGLDDATSRIGRFALAEGAPAGAAARITFNRPPPGQRSGDQEVCLTPTGQGPASGCGEAPRSEGSIAVDQNGGVLTMEALNNLPVTVVQR